MKLVNDRIEKQQRIAFDENQKKEMIFFKIKMNFVGYLSRKHYTDYRFSLMPLWRFLSHYKTVLSYRYAENI